MRMEKSQMKCYNVGNERGVGMPLSEEARQRKNAYNREYQNKVRNNKRRIVIDFNVDSENEIIDWLNSKSNVTGYIRYLILDDMKKSRD